MIPRLTIPLCFSDVYGVTDDWRTWLVTWTGTSEKSTGVSLLLGRPCIRRVTYDTSEEIKRNFPARVSDCESSTWLIRRPCRCASGKWKIRGRTARGARVVSPVVVEWNLDMSWHENSGTNASLFLGRDITLSLWRSRRLVRCRWTRVYTLPWTRPGSPVLCSLLAFLFKLFKIDGIEVEIFERICCWRAVHTDCALL